MIVALRWLLVPGWIAGAVAATLYLPSFAAAEGTGPSGILPEPSAAINTQIRAVKDFSLPLLAQVAIVQYRSGGLSTAVQAEVVARAAKIDAGRLPGAGQIAGAIPVLNTGGDFPASRGEGTTAITFLLFNPSVSSSAAVVDAQALAARYLNKPDDGYRGVTGSDPAQQEEGADVSSALNLIELVAIGLVFVVVGVSFRSIGAPVVALTAVGVAYFTSVRILAAAAEALGFSLPGELEPLIVILVVGVVTDYSIFFLSSHRDQYQAGQKAAASARQSGANVIPLVVVAGITVAAGTATLLVAKLSLYGELGPGMAISAAVAFVIAATFVPGALALLGPLVFWPASRRHPPRSAPKKPTLAMRISRNRLLAGALLLPAVAGLVAAATPLRHMELGLNIVSDLPSGSSAAQASLAASHGFAPGIVSPTEIVVSRHDIGAQRAGLSELQRRLARLPGVAGVLGPGDQSTRLHLGLFVDPASNAARYILILTNDPYGAKSISTERALQDDMPRFLRQSGLPDTQFGVAGDTAVASELTAETRSGIARVSAAIVAVDLVILILFLRALIAPLFLLTASLLAVLAALGVTTAIFQVGGNGLTFFVPVAVAVLLFSFGSDYNIFLVGRIWEDAATSHIRQAVASAGTTASSTIIRAGLALALTFSLLAIVPLASFRSFALAMVLGIAFDTFVVRSLLVPCFLSLAGKWSAWPNRTLMATLASSSDHGPSAPASW